MHCEKWQQQLIVPSCTSRLLALGCFSEGQLSWGMQQGQSLAGWETLIPCVLEEILSVKWACSTLEPDPKWQNNSSGPLSTSVSIVWTKAHLCFSFRVCSSLPLIRGRTGSPVTGQAPMETWAEGICPLAYNQKWTHYVTEDFGWGCAFGHMVRE